MPDPLARVFVKPRRARPLLARHPWLFADSIDRVDGTPRDGDAVAVHAHDGRFIAAGLFNSKSLIRVRLYTWEPATTLDSAFWRQRLIEALRLRRELLQLDEPRGACRLVFSEADGLSGLIVDRYADWLVIQLTSLALAQRLDDLLGHLIELCRPRGVYLRTERGIAAIEGLQIEDRPIWGEAVAAPVTIEQDGLEFEVDLCEGQKTGFYLDQRENRRIVAAHARGRRVLDVFCYSGGFALAAAHAGASAVHAIDVSKSAIELARRNAARNRLDAIQFECGDAFERMESLAAALDPADRFGLVILDPPKFARQARAVPEALRGYLRANLLATALLQPGGLLVSCSCSGHVTREDFAAVFGAVAEQSRRNIRILAQLGQAPDHPVSASCPETGYLKCFIAHVQ